MDGVEDALQVVARDAAGIEQQIDAHSKLGRTNIGSDEVIESGDAPSGLRTVRICAVIEQPLKSEGRYCFTGGEEDWKVAIPFGVDIGAVGDKELHHGDALAVKRCAH